MRQEVVVVEKRELPEGWKVQTLGHIITMRKGRVQEPIFGEQVAGSKPHILVESFDGIYKKFTTSTKGELCTKDDILIIGDGSRYGLIETNLEGYVGSTLGIISTKGDIIKDYLYYFLTFKHDKIRERSKGSGIPHIDKKFLLNLEVFYPQNKGEQQKIVDKLSKQMAQIEMMKKEAEKQSERVNNLMNSYLNELYQKYSISITSLEKYIVGSSNGYGERPNGVEEGPIVLRIADVSSGQVDYSNVRRGEVEPEIQRKYKLNSDDLIFIRVNGSRDFIGRCILFNNEINEPVLFNDHLIRVRVNDEYIPEFVKIWCKTPFIRRYMADTASTSAGQLTINRSVLNEMPIPKIDKSTQKRVIEYYKRLHSEYSNLKKKIDYQLTAIDQLPASILNEVFGQYQIDS